jgi:hypothetical protein
MVHIVFDPDSVQLLGSDAQIGEGLYVGRIYQPGRRGRLGHGHTGNGMGDIFKHVWRFIRPIAMSAGKAVSKEGLEASSRILQNIVQGSDLKETLRTEGIEGVKNLLDKASAKLARKQRQEGSGLYTSKKKGRRLVRQSPKKTPSFLRPEQLIGRRVNFLKRINEKAMTRSDTLGLF